MTVTTDAAKTGLSGASLVSSPLIESIGASSPVVGSGAITAGYTFWHNLPAKATGTVTSFSAYFTSSGTLDLRTLTGNGDGTFSVVDSATVSVSGTGVQSVATALSIPKGGFLAVHVPGSGGAIPSYTASATGFPYYYKAASDISGSNQAASGQTTGQRLEFVFTVSYTDTPHVDDSALDLSVSSGNGVAQLECVRSFAYLPSNWSNTGTWTFSSGAAVSGTNGRANQLRSGNQYGIDNRVLRWEFEITDAAAVFEFLTNPIEGGIQAGSCIHISAAAGTLDVFSRYDGSNIPASITSQPMGFTLATGTRYVFEWTKAGRSFTVSLWNASKPSQSFTYTRAATPIGYSTYPSYGYDQGNMQGAPGVAPISGAAGSLKIWQYTHDASCVVRPMLYVIGDSITEGFTVPDALTLATRLRSLYGTTRVSCSGVGGAVTAGAYTRMQQELAYMRPRWVLIFLGTNADASFAANLQSMVSYAQSLGSNVIVATIPTSAARTASVTALGSSVFKTYWDLELTATGAGSSLTAAFYNNTDNGGASYNDSLHPNALGDLRRFTRLLADVPQLLQ